MTAPVRVYVPLGMLGYGFPESSLREALKRRPDVIAVDAGSTDPGPYYLGAGIPFTSRSMTKRDLGLLLTAALEARIPLIVGSAGGGGGAPHLAWALDILREVARERSLHPRTAVIGAELDPGYLRRKHAAGDMVSFETERDVTMEDLTSCTRVVAQMGPEPIMAALTEGAEVVLAGRAFDAGLSAALPLLAGVDRGIALHMGKIAECGSLVALPRISDGVVCTIHPDRFLIEPADPAKRCLVSTVAAHTLYEKSDPYGLPMPGGVLNVRDATFTQVDERSVEVSGSRFERSSDYFVKLEGAALVGFRTVCIAGLRDPGLIDRLDDVLDRVRTKVDSDLGGALGSGGSYQLLFRIYGRNGVMGALEPHVGPPPHELGLVIEAVGADQETANTVCALARSATLHMGFEGRIATAGNLAFPYSPAEFAAPPVYEFRVYHLLRVDDPSEPFTTEWETL